MNKEKILLHACCGICSGDCIRQLIESDYTPIVYFYNPNLDTREEFIRRLDAQKNICDYWNVDLIVEKYNHNEYLETVKGFETEPEHGKRCDICFALRLQKAAEKTKQLGLKSFTTSLVISPHKNFSKLSEIGKSIAENIGDVDFIAIDFKKKDGFLKTNQLSKKLNLYRQNYCGCEFSKR